MCVIFAVTDKWPSWRLLEQGAEKNPDGLGIAWFDAKDKKVRWIKGLASDVKELEKAMKEVKFFPAGIHFRIASVGGVRKELTHPFPMDHKASLALTGETKGSVLMHNGHWNNWDNTIRDFCLRHKIPMPEGAWSDSRGMAFISSYLGHHILPFLDDRDRMFVLPSDGLWTTYGHWVDPETEHNETGFQISNNALSGPRGHKSTGKGQGVTTYPPGWWNKGVTQGGGGGNIGVDAKAPGLIGAGPGPSAGLQVEIVASGGTHRESTGEIGEEPETAPGKTRAGTLAPGGVNRPKAGPPSASLAMNAGASSSTPPNAKSGGAPQGNSSGDATRIVTLTEDERGEEKEVWNMGELEVWLEEVKKNSEAKHDKAS